MKLNHVKRPLFVSGLFGTALALLGAGSAFGQARNAYYTIQPTADKQSIVHTLSWVALDTQYSGSTYDNPATPGVNEGDKDKITRNTPFGGALTGSAFELHTYNDPLGQTPFTYTPSGAPGPVEVRYNPGNGTPPNSWSSGYVFLGTDGSDGVLAPNISTPKWDDIGSITTEPNGMYGVGWEGVTGFRADNPDGSGATTTDIGLYIDTDDVTGGGAASPIDDVGLAFVGFAQGNPQQAPNTGYVQIVVPKAAAATDTDTYFVDPNGFWPASGWKAAYVAGVHTDNASIEVTVINDASYTPKLAVAGDFDGDLDVDNADIGNLAGNFTGSGGEAKYYRDGDLDDDYDVDNADIGGVAGAFTGSSDGLVNGSPAGNLPGSGMIAGLINGPSAGNLIAGSLAGNLTDSPTIADLVYDPATGNVQLDATESPGSIITVFQFENAAGTFVPGNYISPGGNFGGIFEDVTNLVIADSDLTFAGFSGIVNIGNVFPTGLDLTGLQSYLTTALVTGALGNPQTEIDLVVATVIPEPSTFLQLLVLGGVAALMRRRRKA